MKKDDIRTLIVVLIICIFIVGVFLLLNQKDNVEKMTIIKEYNSFFLIRNCINDYLDYYNNEDKEVAYDILFKEYIKKNNISINDVLENIDSYPKEAYINIDKIMSVSINNNKIYYVVGKILQDDYDNTKVINDNFSIIVLVDYNNVTYSIIPINDNNYKKTINTIKKINIESNENNKLKGTGIINNEQICVLYMSDYVGKLNNDIDDAYSILTTKMKEKYSSIDSYKNYLNSNRNKITTVADKCHVTEKEDYTRTYYVIDSNKNEYTFYEDGIMNYTVEFNFNNDVKE